MSHDSLDLKFGPGTFAGFTPKGIASFSDLRPAAVVRELIQNSLDAAVEAGENTAIVLFRLTRSKTSDIPGIKSYRKAFNAAVQSQKDKNRGALPSQAQRVVSVIERALKQDESDTLSVLDNGVGLDETRMNALLSDGVSAKDESATGTFGNGHSVVIPASDLRYVLYGGITEDGGRIGAGHAILASSTVPTEKHPIAADGFLIHEFLNGGTHKYAQGSWIPDPIAGELEDIRENSISGTAVIIPAFNNFREKGLSLWETVAKAAACNFFQAIDESRLEVWVEDLRPGNRDDLKSLDRSTLKEILEANREEKRSGAFLSGRKAFEAHDVLRSGEHHTVQTGLGEIRIQLLLRPSGNTRIDLCRNGMWITEDRRIPGFYYQFKDLKPFHALLLLDSTTGGRLHELVRNAEGPLHDKLDVKQRLSASEARELRAALLEIRNWLRDKVPKIGSDSYSPNDFLTLDFGDDTGGGKARQAFWGTPTPVIQRGFNLTREDPDPSPDPTPQSPPQPGPKPRPRAKSKPKPKLRPFFQATSVPDGPRRRRIHLECKDSCENAELRLCVDESVDATCDRLRRDEIATVSLDGVKVDGRDVKDNELVRENGRIVGVRLGDLTANTSVRIDAGYELPENLSIFLQKEPALRVEVFKAPSATTQET